MVDALKRIGKGIVGFVLLLALIVAGLKVAQMMGLDAGTVNASGQATANAQEQLAEAESSYTQRAIAQHKIPPGSPRAICDTRDNLIGYWTWDKSVVIFDDQHDATQASCW